MNSTQRATPWEAAVSVGSAVLATLCCWGPLLAALAGTSAAGLAASLERMRPLFLGIAVLSLGFGFRRAYRRPKDCAGACGRSRRLQRIVLWISALLVAGLLLFPHLSLPRAAAPAAPAGPTVQRTVTVRGMTCSGCERTVEQAALDTPGVVEAHAYHGNGLLRLRVEEGKVDWAALRRAVEAAGYHPGDDFEPEDGP